MSAGGSGRRSRRGRSAGGEEVEDAARRDRRKGDEPTNPRVTLRNAIPYGGTGRSRRRRDRRGHESAPRRSARTAGCLHAGLHARELGIARDRREGSERAVEVDVGRGPDEPERIVRDHLDDRGAPSGLVSANVVRHREPVGVDGVVREERERQIGTAGWLIVGCVAQRPRRESKMLMLLPSRATNGAVVQRRERVGHAWVTDDQVPVRAEPFVAEPGRGSPRCGRIAPSSRAGRAAAHAFVTAE